MRNPPDSELNKEFALLFRAPGAGAEDVLEGHLAVDAETVGNGADTVRTESAFRVDEGDLATCATLVFGELSGDAEGVAQLGLERSVCVFGCDWVVAPLSSAKFACMQVSFRSHGLRYNLPKTSVMLCVQMPPPSIASTALEPVEIIRTVWRRSEISAPDANTGGCRQLSHTGGELTSILAATSCKGQRRSVSQPMYLDLLDLGLGEALNLEEVLARGLGDAEDGHDAGRLELGDVRDVDALGRGQQCRRESSGWTR